jgi:hypothetical protein
VFERFHLPALQAQARWSLVGVADPRPERLAWIKARLRSVPSEAAGQHSDLRVYCLMRNRWRIMLHCFAVRTFLLLAPVLLLFELFQLAGCVPSRLAGHLASRSQLDGLPSRRLTLNRRRSSRSLAAWPGAG